MNGLFLQALGTSGSVSATCFTEPLDVLRSIALFCSALIPFAAGARLPLHVTVQARMRRSLELEARLLFFEARLLCLSIKTTYVHVRASRKRVISRARMKREISLARNCIISICFAAQARANLVLKWPARDDGWYQ